MTDTERQYYYDVADYSGLVAAARMETFGLTTAHYMVWYERRSWSYFFRKEIDARWSGWLMKRAAKANNTLSSKLLNRRQGRLYVRRKVRGIKQTLLTVCQYERGGYLNLYTVGEHTAADKLFFLATELRRIAEELIAEKPILAEARLASIFTKPLAQLSPDFDFEQSEFETGKRIARIEYFSELLAKFEAATHPTPAVQTTKIDAGQLKEKTFANLLKDPFTETDLTRLLVDLEVVDGDSSRCIWEGRKLGGRARGPISAFPAAFRVLNEAGHLRGTPAQWGRAAQFLYGVDLGSKALGYKTDSETGNESNVFHKYVEQAELWLESWSD